MKRNFFKALVCFLINVIPGKKYIVFESFPEIDGSPWAIYQEFLKRGIDRNYKLVWLVDVGYVPPSGVKCVPFFGNLSRIQRIKRTLLLFKTKLIVDSNRYVYKRNEKTIRLHTRHGGTLKRADFYSDSIGDLNYILSLSCGCAAVESSVVYKRAGLSQEKFLPLGYPNNDRLFDPIGFDVSGFWKEVVGEKGNYKKIVGWMPTYRKDNNGKNFIGSRNFPFGIPLVYHKETLDLLNEILKEMNVLLAIKIHHAQKADYSLQNYSNIVLIPQKLQEKFSVSMMELIKSFDALITDYSAVYYEYLLLNRPIALSIDDYEEYLNGTGFCVDYFDWIKGAYLKDDSDLVRFIGDVAKGVDSAKAEREAAMRRIHEYIDNKSTQRVVDFLIKEVKL